MHTKTFVIEMPDSIDIQPETIVYALSYISNHDFVVKEAAQHRVQADGAYCTCKTTFSHSEYTCIQCGKPYPPRR